MKTLTLRSAGLDSTRSDKGGLFALIVVFALGLAFAGAPLAQTTSKVQVHQFEVISVDGQRLVVRDESGTNEYTVPDDFRMTVNGKKMTVSELKPGMKGTATVTTTTTSKPVYVTDIKEGVVLDTSPGSITIRGTDGVRKRFTRDQLDQQGVQIYKDGKVIRLDQAQNGDTITATIVSKSQPVVVTEKDVQATTAAKAKPETPPAQMAKADTTPAATTPPAATPPAAAPAAEPVTPATPPAAVAPAPSEPAGLGMTWWLVIVALILIGIFVIARRRSTPPPPA